MKLQKSTVLIMLVGLLLVAFAANLAAQSSTQKKEAGNACCAMDSCCKGDSCEMKEGANAADASKHNCCCAGDSCDMKKEGMANHAEHAGCCGNGESCDMSKENTRNSEDKGECCCKSKMKHEQHMKNKRKTA
jgi:hypothetical protein